jgi:DNA-binding CsgD family transcriptional regulator/transcriptional regulator
MAARWTKEEKEKLVSLREQGLTGKEIAAYFPGRSEATIKNLLAKLSPKQVKWTDEEDSRIKQLYLEGLSYKEIARKFPTRSSDAIKTRINIVMKPLVDSGEYSLRNTNYSRTWNKEKQDLILKMREEGKTYKEMAEATGVSTGFISHKMVALIEYGKVQKKYEQKDWTLEEELQIAEWRAQGKNTDFIAEQLGRSYASVANHSSKLIKAGALDPAISTDKATKVYLVHFLEEDFYKVGITSNVKARFQGYPKYDIIEVLDFETPEKAKEVEAKLLNLVKPFKYTPLIFKSYGVTECFQPLQRPQSIMDLVAYLQTWEK